LKKKAGGQRLQEITPLSFPFPIPNFVPVEQIGIWAQEMFGELDPYVMFGHESREPLVFILYATQVFFSRPASMPRGWKVEV